VGIGHRTDPGRTPRNLGCMPLGPLVSEVCCCSSEVIGFGAKRILKVPIHTSMQPCFKCRCSRNVRDALNLTNTGGDAPWRCARRESLEWVPDLDNMCPLLGCPGFDEEFIIIGFLHCHDLGVTQDVLGNIFWEALVWLGLPGNTREQRCKVLWRMVQVLLQTTQHSKGGPDPITLCHHDQEGQEQCKYLVKFGVFLAQQVDTKWGTLAYTPSIDAHSGIKQHLHKH